MVAEGALMCLKSTLCTLIVLALDAVLLLCFLLDRGPLEVDLSWWGSWLKSRGDWMPLEFNAPLPIMIPLWKEVLDCYLEKLASYGSLALPFVYLE